MRRWLLAVQLVVLATFGSPSASPALPTPTSGAYLTTESLFVGVGSAARLADDTSARRKRKRPRIFPHANVRAEATGPSGAVVTYRRAIVRRARSVRYSKASGTVFRLGTTVVTISARNRAGVTRSTFKVIVVDTTAPLFTPPSNITAEARGPAGATVSYGPLRASDLVDVNVSVSCSPSPGSIFPVGTTTVSCSARDRAGNGTTGSFAVAVLDTTPPRFPVVLADLSVPPTSAAGAAVTFPAIAVSDLVDGNVPFSCSSASGSVFPRGTTTVTCSARDRAGNGATGSFRVVVFPAKPGHYLGTTSQGKDVSFDLLVFVSGGNGVAVSNVVFDFSGSCTPAQTVTGKVELYPGLFFSSVSPGGFQLSSVTIPITGGGSSGTGTVTFEGTFGSPTSATGTLTVHESFTSPAGVECDTGSLSWTASTP
jgi:HYR domain-containing protein